MQFARKEPRFPKLFVEHQQHVHHVGAYHQADEEREGDDERYGDQVGGVSDSLHAAESFAHCVDSVRER